MTDYLSAGFELKAVDQGQRTISGYASVFGNLDRASDIVDHKAFDRTLREKQPADILVTIGHKVDDLPVGVPIVIRTDAKGLYTESRIFNTRAGDDLLQTARELLAHGQTLGMSFSYNVRDYKLERTGEGKAVRRLTDLDLIEITYGARQASVNQAAQVIGVKQQGGASDGAGHTGVMVAFFLDPETAKQLALPGGEPAEGLHLTLAYLGKLDETPTVARARALVNLIECANHQAPLIGQVGGWGRFQASESSDGKDVLYAAVDMPGLNEFRARLANLLEYSGAPPSDDHGFTPHITLAYVDPDSKSPSLDLGQIPLAFDTVWFCEGDERTALPLRAPLDDAGTEALYAAKGATMPYEIRKDGNQWCVYNKDTGAKEGCSDSEEMAKRHMSALYAHAGGKMATDDLPDSAFLFIEEGGVKDTEGKTVPRALRRHPYRDGTGAVDTADLRASLGALWEAKMGGDPARKIAAWARGRKLLDLAERGQKTDLGAEWLEDRGAPIQLYAVSCLTADLAAQVADAHKAMRLLGEDTKAGRRMQAAMRAKLKEIMSALAEIDSWAEMSDNGEEGVAKLRHYRAELERLRL